MQFTISWRPSASSRGAFHRVLAQPGRAVASFAAKAPDIITRHYTEYIEAVFDTEGQPPWTPLAPFTMMDRRRLGFPPEHPILFRTGSFKASFLAHGIVNRINLGGHSFMLCFGTDDPRFLKHQEGTMFVPARPIAPTSRYREAFCTALGKSLGLALDAQVQANWSG